MGINETKLPSYLYNPNDEKHLKSNSLKINKHEQKYIQTKIQRQESDTNTHKHNIEKYLEKISDNETETANNKIDGPSISKKKVIITQNTNENSFMNDNLLNNNIDNQNNEISKSNSTSDLSQNDSTSQQSNDNISEEENYSNSQKNTSSINLNSQSDINLDMKNVFFDRKIRKNNTVKMESRIDISSNEYKLNSNNFENINNNNNNIYQNDYELNFYRNGEEIRNSYMSKLICKKVWTPSIKGKTHNTLILFDWDDTLLCTTFLTKNGVYDENLILTDKEKEKVAKLEFSVLRLLNLAIEKGNVFIITNAGQGWVEYSAEKYYPSVFKVLKKIKIISARGEYERQYPNDSRMWKIQAFLNMQKEFNSNLVTNIICLGDSFIEIEAGHILASKFNQAFIKTVKFRESPKPEELNKQLTLVADQFDSIYKSIKNLTIRVEKKKK